MRKDEGILYAELGSVLPYTERLTDHTRPGVPDCVISAEVGGRMAWAELKAPTTDDLGIRPEQVSFLVRAAMAGQPALVIARRGYAYRSTREVATLILGVGQMIGEQGRPATAPSVTLGAVRSFLLGRFDWDRALALAFDHDPTDHRALNLGDWGHVNRMPQRAKEMRLGLMGQRLGTLIRSAPSRPLDGPGVGPGSLGDKPLKLSEVFRIAS